MPLDRWFLASRASGGKPSTQPTLKQTTPFASQKWKKCQKGDSGAVVDSGTLPTQPLASNISREFAQMVEKTPQETQLKKLPIIISS